MLQRKPGLLAADVDIDFFDDILGNINGSFALIGEARKGRYPRANITSMMMILGLRFSADTILVLFLCWILRWRVLTSISAKPRHPALSTKKWMSRAGMYSDWQRSIWVPSGCSEKWGINWLIP